MVGNIDWLPIADLPEEMKDGRLVNVRRVYSGRVVAVGLACFAVPVESAPMLQPSEPHPLGDYIDREAEQATIEKVRISRTWLRPDRIYRFPEPTHWREGE